MTIDRLGSVDPVGQLNKAQKNKGVNKADKSDSINVSLEARRQEELYQIAEAVKATPDIRMDRVEAAKTRLQDPEYVNKAIDSVAGSLLDILSV